MVGKIPSDLVSAPSPGSPGKEERTGKESRDIKPRDGAPGRRLRRESLIREEGERCKIRYVE